MSQLFCNEEFFMSNTVTWQISEHINSEKLDDLLEHKPWMIGRFIRMFKIHINQACSDPS